MTATLCIGCRAVTGAPLNEADRLIPRADWEIFDCDRCGVQDVRPRSGLRDDGRNRDAG